MSTKKEKAPLLDGGTAHYTAAPPTVVYQPTQFEPAPPDDQLLMSLFTTFCCFWPLGVFAIIKSMEARSAYQAGRYQEASVATRSARTFNKLSILVGVIILVIVFLLQLGWIIPTAVFAAIAAKNSTTTDT